MVKLCRRQFGNCRVWDCACTTIHTARRQICVPRTVTFLVDTIQLLEAFTEAHAMSALERPGEVPFTRGITWVETRLGQEYRDRDSTSFQAHLKLPTNAIRTHVVEAQNAYSRFWYWLTPIDTLTLINQLLTCKTSTNKGKQSDCFLPVLFPYSRFAHTHASVLSQVTPMALMPICASLANVVVKKHLSFLASWSG